jgi:hypothetical protein
MLPHHTLRGDSSSKPVLYMHNGSKPPQYYKPVVGISASTNQPTFQSLWCEKYLGTNKNFRLMLVKRTFRTRKLVLVNVFDGTK